MLKEPIIYNQEVIKRLKKAVLDNDQVRGLTHNFYRYPARFSPQFVREIIKIFSSSGDTVLDPFMGGGTTIVEAIANNRNAIGIDISPIATFVTKAKSTLIDENDIEKVKKWAALASQVQLHTPMYDNQFWEDEGYKNNVPWTLRKLVSIYLNELRHLEKEDQRIFANCAILKTAQWALDCRKKIPNTEEFRKKLINNISILSKGARDLKCLIDKKNNIPRAICLNGSCENISSFEEIKSMPKAKLVITSPPYVGVQILYHQWQVNSRKRTRAPFWIIDQLDGHGSSHYTFGHYTSHSKAIYFENARKAFTEIKNVIADDAIVVQLLGFSDAKKFLPKYLEAMDIAGFEEIPLYVDSMNRIKRIWRDVPNRKWYAKNKDSISSSKEVLLIHKLK